jgi:hypothetical protein
VRFTQHTDSLPLGQVTRGNTSWLFCGCFLASLNVSASVQTVALADAGVWMCADQCLCWQLLRSGRSSAMCCAWQATRATASCVVSLPNLPYMYCVCPVASCLTCLLQYDAVQPVENARVAKPGPCHVFPPCSGNPSGSTCCQAWRRTTCRTTAWKQRLSALQQSTTQRAPPTVAPPAHQTAHKMASPVIMQRERMQRAVAMRRRMA